MILSSCGEGAGEDEAMTSATSSADTGGVREECRFPNCTRPVRERAGEGGGKPPVYCDLVNPVTGKPAHTPLTAARERERRKRQDATGQPAGLVGEAPASAARDRAAGLLEQFRAVGEQLTGTVTAAIEAMACAGDPESVAAELTTAERRIQAAEAVRDQATIDAAVARQAAEEATAARDEAITELDATDATLLATRAELEQAQAEHTTTVEGLRAEHASELDRHRSDMDRQLTAVRTQAAEQVSAVEQRAIEQIRAAQADAQQRIQVATTARDQALAEASAARQTATDATARVAEAREEVRQARIDHRDELAALRREHRDELAAERQRADAALDTVRAEHRRETQALQTALTALRTVQPDQPTPPRAARRAGTKES
jgi:hypothetical protein